MPNISASGAPSNINIANLQVTTPVVSNFSLPTANTEVAVVLPANAQKFTLRARGNSILKISYAVGTSGTTYLTIWPGGCYEENNINKVTTTLYIQASKTNETVEVVSWS